MEQLLQELHLKGMEKALGPVLAKAEKSGLSVLEVIYTLLLEEKKHRQERRLQYRIKQARLRYEWSLESFPFQLQPSIDKSGVICLAGLSFIQRRPAPAHLD